MSVRVPPPPTPWSAVASLAEKSRNAETFAALAFVIVNDTFTLLPYRSALLLNVDGARARLAYASGLSSVDRKTPYGAWVEQVVGALLPRLADQTRFRAKDVPASLAATWPEYWPETVHLHRIVAHDGATLAVVVYISEVDWPPGADAMLAVVHALHAAAVENMRLRGRRLRRMGRDTRGRSSLRTKLILLAVLLAIGAMFVPIRQFVIAPAEIISLESVAVTSPVDGIISELVATPNQAVRAGEVLVRLDDTAVRNRLESARQALEVARAEYLAGVHRAMIASERGTEIGVLRGRINERLAETAFLEEQLNLLVLRASRDGIAVYGQVNDLIGKPVNAGQKVMELADPSRIGVQVWVPVADAINLRQGERFHVMLYADPLTPRAATIDQASYQAMRSPDGVAAYRVRATMEAQDASRLGLRGSAKMDGDLVALGYFLFRRPIVVVRQWLGL